MTTLNRREINKLLKSFNGFQRKVYSKVLEIPLGETRSYKWVAKELNCPKRVRLVAKLLSENPYPFIIPCHRVVKSDGSLGGYMFGNNLKKYLLDLEKRIKLVIMVNTDEHR
ncbi:MAG: MGMT family protein [Candidatus Omnitrophica bacterium]|nr:MGMT family protein [Candidatus Omnitrophota bacterium]